jgi:hypothetical protein
MIGHEKDCECPEEQTFECARCRREFYVCCQYGGQEGDNDSSPWLCLGCALEYEREQEAEREARIEAGLEASRLRDQAVTSARDRLVERLRAAGVEVSDFSESSLSASQYFYAGARKVRVSDHAINHRGPGFWKDPVTPLHASTDFELIVPATDDEVEELASRIVARVRRDEADAD